MRATSRARAALGAALGAALAVALMACGIPQQSRARIVPDRDVPFGLLDTSTTATSAGR